MRAIAGWQGLGWLVAALLAALHAWMLHRYAVDFFFQDDFSQLLAAPGYFHVYPTWREKIADLFSLSVEHRIVTLRLAAIVQSWLPGGLNFRGLIFSPINFSAQYWVTGKTQRLFRALKDSDWVIFWNTLPLRGIVPGHYRVGYALGEESRAEVQWSDVWLDVR